MDDRIPPLAGAVGAASLVLGVLAPYFVLSAPEASGLSTYYGYGLVGPLGIAVLTVFLLVAFLAGVGERTGPGTIAGTTLVLGVVVLALTLQWALAVDPVVVQSIGEGVWLDDHRWVLVGLAASMPAAAAGYARSLGLV
ncbi:hypothetical protein BRD00_12920 [Halobacteriales archaeon QS_8_69_26]|nr:MAG: hypothetical protein BRD00_12920 [Halobacteriales archaeon QS_8_69_26]